MMHEFRTFDKILYRANDYSVWEAGFYERKFVNNDDKDDNRHYIIFKEDPVYCLPFEGNEHLLGTSDASCLVNEFEYGDKITVTGIDREEHKCIFIEEDPCDPSYLRVLQNKTVRSFKKVGWKLRKGWDEEE